MNLYPPTKLAGSGISSDHLTNCFIEASAQANDRRHTSFIKVIRALSIVVLLANSSIEQLGGRLSLSFLTITVPIAHRLQAVVVSGLILGSSGDILRSLAEVVAHHLGSSRVAIVRSEDSLVLLGVDSSGTLFVVLLLVLDVGDTVLADKIGEDAIPALLFILTVIEGTALREVAVLSLASEHLVIERMEHGLEVVSGTFVLLASCGLSVFEIIGFIGKFFFDIGGQNHSSLVLIMMIEGAFVLVILVLIMSGHFSGSIGAVFIRTRKHLIKDNLSESHNLHC